ncbi:unnamed protein product, partial [Symbiodinium pilosum]
MFKRRDWWQARHINLCEEWKKFQDAILKIEEVAGTPARSNGTFLEKVQALYDNTSGYRSMLLQRWENRRMRSEDRRARRVRRTLFSAVIKADTKMEEQVSRLRRHLQRWKKLLDMHRHRQDALRKKRLKELIQRKAEQKKRLAKGLKLTLKSRIPK